MGGVGKTELVVKYARQHEHDYPGGVCWFSVRSSDIATEILTFAKNYLKLEIPQRDFQEQPLTLKQQIDWCWQNWQPPEGLVLVIFDDVNDLENFNEYLPTFKRFRILITTRLRNIDTNIEEISLDVLSPEEALELLINLVEFNKENINKVNKELETAKELCEWLGYLPLGIELVGRYIAKKPPHFKIAKMLEELKKQRLQQEGINPKQKTLSTAQLGVKAAFELSWLELNEQTQKLAALLSLFAAEIFEWSWVESITNSLSWDENGVEEALEQLYQRHLVNSLEVEDKHYYKIHTLISEFLQEKLAALEEIDELKRAFALYFIDIARSISWSATLELINSVKNAIPHLATVAENLTDWINDENLISPFVGLVRFYYGQGLYTQAQLWCEQCLSVVKSRLGENHPDYATSLNNLALLYNFQGKYHKAEPLYIQALELTKRILGENHPDYARSLNNLALLYNSQGKYDKAEPLCIQALELNKRILGENHPIYAISLNNLAGLYYSQGKYDKAEPLCVQALELTKRILGENHPGYARSLNNLAGLYESQGKYDKAEPLYIQALELRKSILGENHPNYATSLSNLALLYKSQGKYDKAEPLCIQALELRQRILGENHPGYARSLNHLALLYNSQGKYDKAEPLCIQALELRQRILGENHPGYARSLNHLALIYNSQGKYDKAEPLCIQALELRKHILGENHPDYASSLKDLAGLYDSQEKYDKAEPLYIQVLKIFEQRLGINHPNTNICRKNLENLRSAMNSTDL
jgi:tetratricopeptide (TPR) repeat protein